MILDLSQIFSEQKRIDAAFQEHCVSVHARYDLDPPQDDWMFIKNSFRMASNMGWCGGLYKLELAGGHVYRPSWFAALKKDIQEFRPDVGKLHSVCQEILPLRMISRNKLIVGETVFTVCEKDGEIEFPKNHPERISDRSFWKVIAGVAIESGCQGITMRDHGGDTFGITWRGRRPYEIPDLRHIYENDVIRTEHYHAVLSNHIESMISKGYIHLKGVEFL